MSQKVLVVGFDAGVVKMYKEEGWEVTTDPLQTDIDLVQFTGGEDVDPSYYEETRHPATRSNPVRDAREAGIYYSFVGQTPLAGICRGAQFLNVMNGGKLWQHVTKHANGPHSAYDEGSGEVLMVTSTHHQMIIPTDAAVLLLTAGLRGTKQSADYEELGDLREDVEAVYYPGTESLCYQPHPEYVTIDHPCRRKFFDYVENLLSL